MRDNRALFTFAPVAVNDYMYSGTDDGAQQHWKFLFLVIICVPSTIIAGFIYWARFRCICIIGKQEYSSIAKQCYIILLLQQSWYLKLWFAHSVMEIIVWSMKCMLSLSYRADQGHFCKC